MHGKMYSVLFVLLLMNMVFCGEYKKLGSHSPPSKGATVLGGKFPPPQVFYHHFVKLGQPLLMKNVLNESLFPAYLKWTDSYLRDRYGNEIVDVERGKKEDRAGNNVQLSLQKFLDIYDQSNLYMVHSVSESMKDEIIVPHSLQCGGFQDNIQDVVVWFSGGETKSVLHYDTVDNINCLLDGEKKLVLIDRKYEKKIEESGWVEEGGYSEVDVDSVDPNKFPGVYNAAWTAINMQKGDCVYIPYKWYHHVYSPSGRNLAVNLWFSHLWWFNTTDCNDFTSKAGKPLSEFEMASPNQQLRSVFVAQFEGKGDMSVRSFKLNTDCDTEQDAEKLFDMINKNNDRKVTIEELYSFDIEEAVKQVPGCFRMDLGESDEEEVEEVRDDDADDDRGDNKDSDVGKKSQSSENDKSESPVDTEERNEVRTDSKTAESKTKEPERVDTFSESLEKLVDDIDIQILAGDVTDKMKDKNTEMDETGNKDSEREVNSSSDELEESDAINEKQIKTGTRKAHAKHDEF